MSDTRESLLQFYSQDRQDRDAFAYTFRDTDGRLFSIRQARDPDCVWIGPAADWTVQLWDQQSKTYIPMPAPQQPYVTGNCALLSYAEMQDFGIFLLAMAAAMEESSHIESLDPINPRLRKWEAHFKQVYAGLKREQDKDEIIEHQGREIDRLSALLDEQRQRADILRDNHVDLQKLYTGLVGETTDQALTAESLRLELERDLRTRDAEIKRLDSLIAESDATIKEQATELRTLRQDLLDDCPQCDGARWMTKPGQGSTLFRCERCNPDGLRGYVVKRNPAEMTEHQGQDSDA